MTTRDTNNALSMTGGTRSLVPPRMKIDVIEEQNQYIINAELPGVTKEDVKVTVDNDILTITAERKNEINEEDKNKRYVRVERSYGVVSRSLRLPPGCDTSKIQARHENGILKITIPRDPNAIQQKQVQIQ